MTADTRLNFGDAIQLLKEGARLARTGWNGRGMFIYLVPAASYPVQTGAAKAHFGAGAMVPYNAYLAIKNVDETVSTWVPSVSDCLAEDWVIVGDVGAAIESKTYPDGTMATGPGPLPEASPAEQSIEDEIQAKGKTAARVTPDDIQREIVGEHYFTAEQGARHPDAKNPLDFGDIPENLGLLTFCVLRLRNGFTVTGESACASPENFDAAIGRRIARENAVQKIWPLLGFRLRDKLAAGA
ncbi:MULTISPECIES: Gp49 family protein [Delftia]|uniref:Gp49 family protein n=1 Tax=Delftia deserti TaxID=1651218 RepID=A0ABW5EV52_9BURK